jgi:hypothetical protein
MRCMICDYSPTAPSLSIVQPPRGVKLAWDDKEQGWTCGNACGRIDTVDVEDGEIDLDLVEVIEGEAALS